MKVFNLECTRGHGFEGWFGSEDDYDSQRARGLLECPLCGLREVRKLPAAPRLNLGARPTTPSARSPAASPRAPVPAQAPQALPVPAAAEGLTPERHSVEALWMQAVRHVMANTQDVGQNFAEEARRMHYGEIEQRGIRGQTTPAEAKALDEEGIEVFSLPVPAALKGPAH
ncbi:MAG: hypothetical protein RL722_726 [Pseudomonadota bacterium]|jgi:hypothetical protein